MVSSSRRRPVILDIRLSLNREVNPKWTQSEVGSPRRSFRLLAGIGEYHGNRSAVDQRQPQLGRHQLKGADVAAGHAGVVAVEVPEKAALVNGQWAGESVLAAGRVAGVHRRAGGLQAPHQG